MLNVIDYMKKRLGPVVENIEPCPLGISSNCTLSLNKIQQHGFVPMKVDNWFWEYLDNVCYEVSHSK